MIKVQASRKPIRMSSQPLIQIRPELVGRPSSTLSRSEKILAMAQNEIQRELGIENFDPVIMLMKIAADPEMKPELRVQAAGKAAPYVHSTLKSIEVSGDKDNPIQIEMNDSKARLMQLLGDIDAEIVESTYEEEDYDEDAREAYQDIEYVERRKD